ncbi:MAG: glycosyltransferase [Oscillibacter sp.]|nr:glycosyltransferase [Oscillibacter sp.]
MEREKPLISVIVPVYNVEACMERCLDSILAQTYPSVEAILVDDASTDNSGAVCDRYAACDARITAIHFPENRGPSAARNEGIRQAQGAYISFVDSDDYIEPDMLETLYQSMVDHGTEVSACGAFGIALKDGPAAVYSQAEAVRRLAQGTPFNHVPWGKLYHAELVKKRPFDEGVYYSEDLLFLYQLLKQARRVSYVPDRLYHYVQREGSQVQSGVDARKCTALSAQDAVCQDASIHFPEAAADFRQLALEVDRSLAVLAVKKGAQEGKTFACLKRIQRNVRRHFRWKSLSLCPRKKDAAMILTLYVSALIFWAAAAVHCRFRRRKEGENGA